MDKLNTRITQTHDIEANWNREQLKNFVPNKGELIVYDPDNKYTYARFKIGDGKSTIQELPFSLDRMIESMFNVHDNVVCLDAGRIEDYTTAES